MSDFPVIGDGFWAEVKSDKHHLRLFSEAYELGHVAVVYDMTSRAEIARHDVDSIEGGKKQAEDSAAIYLKHAHGIASLPTVRWQPNHQSRPKNNV